MRHWVAAASASDRRPEDRTTDDDPQEDDVHATLIATAEAATESSHALPFAPVVFGAGAFVGLLAMLLVTYAFRSVGSRH